MTMAVTGTTVPEEWVVRYLALLGVERDAPSASALARLTRAHHHAVVFENVTSLIRRRTHLGQPVPPPDPQALLANWEHGRGGGVCFELADLCGRLLGALGYRVTSILGRTSFPGSHQSIVVDLDGGRYLVEAGVGAPFLEPILLEGTVEVRRAGLAYRFHTDEAGEGWIQDHLVDGEWAPFCYYDLRPSLASDRDVAYQRHHTPGMSWVTGSPILVRCEDDAVYQLRRDRLTSFTSEGKRTEKLSGPADYARLATEMFRLPALPVQEGMEAWSALKVASAAG